MSFYNEDCETALTCSRDWERLGEEIVEKISRREPLVRKDLVDYCALNAEISRRFLLGIGVFVLAILIIIILVQLETEFGYHTLQIATWLALIGSLFSLGKLGFQNDHHCREIEERLYCYHCESPFEAKDVKAVLDSDCCPYCGGLSPIILLSFKKLEPETISTNCEEKKICRANHYFMSETEFSERIQAIQDSYWKRASIELPILLWGLTLSPLIFGCFLSSSELSDSELTFALLAFLVVITAMFGWMHFSSNQRLSHIALSCPRCDQDVLLCVAERTGCCQHCGNKLFESEFFETTLD